MTRRALVTLVLFVALPLRTLAGAAMPCCPIDMPMGISHAMPGMTHADDARADPRVDERHDPSTPGDHDTDRRPMSMACCAMVAIGAPASVAIVVPHGAPTRGHDAVDAIAAFLTDAPERPPRPILSA